MTVFVEVLVDFGVVLGFGTVTITVEVDCSDVSGMFKLQCIVGKHRTVVKGVTVTVTTVTVPWLNN